MKADAVKCRPFTCVSCQVPQFCLSASRSLRRLIPKSKSRENAVYRYKAIVVNTPYRKNTLSQKVLASGKGAVKCEDIQYVTIIFFSTADTSNTPHEY